MDGAGRVIVKAEDGSETALQAKDIVIATGSEPTPLPGVNVDNQRIIDSTGALALPQVPKHLVVIGAGVIGLELGSVWRRLVLKSPSSNTSIGICPGTDEETAKTLQKALAKQGNGIQTGQQGHPGQD